MSLTDDIEEKAGVSIDELNAVEKETYFLMLQEVQKSQLSLDKFRDYIIAMRDAVEEELCKTDISDKDDIMLKARLKNYRLIESFLLSPERAKKQLEDMLANVVANVK